MKIQMFTKQKAKASHDGFINPVIGTSFRNSSTSRSSRALGADIVALSVGLTILSFPIMARAQVSNTIPSLYPGVNLNQTNMSEYVQHATGPLSESYTSGAESVFSVANYGLLGSSASLASVNDGSSNFSEQSYNSTGFVDAVTVAVPGSPTLMVPTTVTFNLFGSYSLTTYSAIYSSKAYMNISIDGAWFTSTNSLVSSGDYEYIDQIQNNSQAPGYTPTVIGSLSFTTNLQNDTTYFFRGDLDLTTDAQWGGSVTASYQNTAVFDMSSTTAGATFIGSQGTNYSTLTDPAGSAAAPEPGSAALVLSGIFPIAAAGIRCLRRKRTTAWVDAHKYTRRDD